MAAPAGESLGLRTDRFDPYPLLEGKPDNKSLNDSLFLHVWGWKIPKAGWWKLFGMASAGLGLMTFAIVYTLVTGIGAWGNNNPVGWAFDIINFVWWIGIGHAGTLISAILLLFQQKWRTSINRFAEAMTIFAVMCAGLFPLLHTGRPWFAYWLLPYPSTLTLWPQFKSPLVWDVFAVSTYLTISVLFWFLGLVPDLAALRDSSPGRLARKIYGFFSLGWRGSGRHWHDYKFSYLILAGMSAPLVLSVHSIVSFDFATSLVPGWHTTVFPPYFVAGAVFSGFAMVMTLMLPARHYLGLKHVVTLKHIENMNKIMLATGMIVTYGYAMEHFVAWYSGNEFEFDVFFKTRMRGPYAFIYWLMIFCNVVIPQAFWFKKARTSLWWSFVASIFINVGMWCERFNIIVTPLHRDFLTSKWEMYFPTWVDMSLFVGTLGFFSFNFLLFLRFVPAIAVMEVKEVAHELSHPQHGHGHGTAASGGAH